LKPTKEFASRPSADLALRRHWCGVSRPFHTASDHKRARHDAERFHGALDALVACAGISEHAPRTLLVNYFGAVRTLSGLQPLL